MSLIKVIDCPDCWKRFTFTNNDHEGIEVFRECKYCEMVICPDCFRNHKKGELDFFKKLKEKKQRENHRVCKRNNTTGRS